MPRTQINIPLAKGIDQRLDERLRGPDNLVIARNGYYRRNDALTKRHGFTKIPAATVFNSQATTPATFGTPKGLLSSGDELLIRGYRELYALAGGSAQLSYGWWNRGDLSPFTGRQRPLFSDQRSVGTTDVAEVPGFVCHAQTTINHAASGTDWRTDLVFTAETTAGEVLLNRRQVLTDASSTSTNLNITGVRCVNCDSASGGAAAVFTGVQLEANPTTGTLRWYRWATSALMTDPQQVIQHTDLYYPNFSYNKRFYDGCPGPNGGWAYAYCRQTSAGGAPLTGDIPVYVKNDTATVATVNIALPAPYDYATAVSIVYGGLGGQFYLVAVGVDNATSNRAVILWALNPTTLAVNFGPVVVNTKSSTTGTYNSVGVVEGQTNAGNFNVVVVFGDTLSDGSSPVSLGTPAQFPRTTHAIYSVAGAPVAPGFTVRVLNTEPVSKPWFRNGRCYMAVRYLCAPSAGGPTGDRNGYAAEAIVDLGVGDSETAGPPAIGRKPRMVGRYEFGASVPYNIVAKIYGSLQQVQPTGTSTNRYSTTRMVQALGQNVLEQMVGADEVEVNFAGIVTSAATTRGTATLGGGNCSWYAGAVTEELGWVGAPFIADATAVAHGAGSLPAGTYSYVAFWEAYDEKGNLTRSLPGPVTTITFGGGGGANAVELYVTSLGPTQRYDKRKFGLGIYRAGSDGIFRRCIEPSHDALDSESTNCFFPTIIDRGEALDVLYTQGGAELEAAGPDGAAFVTTTSKRVWLSGFFRRDRVQYSKPYDPTTANEYALTPEFNDAFSFLLPGGENVTGLVELDDKVIVFTSSNIYAIAGNGPDDGGRGNDFSGLQLIASDTGCVDARSVVATPAGIFFQTPSGFFVLGRDLALDYIGAAVRDITDVYTEVTSAALVPAANHVRFTLRQGGDTSTILIYDFDQRAWIEWRPQWNNPLSGGASPLNIVGSALHAGAYYVLTAEGNVYKEDTSTHFDDGNIFVPMTIETGWLQVKPTANGMAEAYGQWQRIRQIGAMCKNNDPHDLTISLYQDFGAAASQTYTWPSATIAAQKLQELVEMRVAQQKCTSFKLRIVDSPSVSTVTGQGYECAGFSVELGGKRGLYKPGTQQRN